MEVEKEKLLEAGDKLGALNLEADTSDEMAMADYRRDIGVEKDEKRQAEAEKRLAELKGRVQERRATYREYLNECVKLGKTKVVYINDYEWAAWEGRYSLNGVQWSLRRGHNDVPLDIAERIEADRKIAEDERWFNLAVEIGDKVIPDYVQGVGHVATAGILKTETLAALLGKGSRGETGEYSKRELNAQKELAKRIAKAKGRDASIPPGPSEIEYK